ncbi:MAG: hypothetical protein ACRCZS_02380 [Chroococcidiopsis sp.]
MDYHTEIERLRNELLQNRSSYTQDQLKAGYQQLLEMTDNYLAAEGK